MEARWSVSCWRMSASSPLSALLALSDKRHGSWILQQSCPKAHLPVELKYSHVSRREFMLRGWMLRTSLDGSSKISCKSSKQIHVNDIITTQTRNVTERHTRETPKMTGEEHMQKDRPDVRALWLASGTWSGCQCRSREDCLQTPGSAHKFNTIPFEKQNVIPKKTSSFCLWGRKRQRLANSMMLLHVMLLKLKEPAAPDESPSCSSKSSGYLPSANWRTAELPNGYFPS